MRIRHRDWPRASLLSRETGVATEDVRRLLGVSPTGRIEALERRISELERHLALRHRHFRGVMLGDDKILSTPDRDGWLQMHSPDASVTVERDPNKKPNVIALTAAGGGGGCKAAWTTITPNTGDTLVADECDDTLCDVGEVSVFVRPQSDGSDPGAGSGGTERLGWIVLATFQEEPLFQTNGYVMMRLDDGTFCQLPALRIPSIAPVPSYPCP